MKTFLNAGNIIIVFCFLLFGYLDMNAQQNTNTSGGNAGGTGGSVSFSLGQIDYLTATGFGGTITEGLQQPYEILVVSGIEETNINLVLSVYPNPAVDFVILSVQNADTQNMTYQLYDAQGKLIEKQKLNGSQTSISVSDLANEIYFIKVFNGNKELKIFKIIKNK